MNKTPQASKAIADAIESLYESAVTIVLTEQKASISLLQRRLAVGYTAGSNLIDQMFEDLIVGLRIGDSNQREVLMTLDEWHARNARRKAPCDSRSTPK